MPQEGTVSSSSLKIRTWGLISPGKQLEGRKKQDSNAQPNFLNTLSFFPAHTHLPGSSAHAVASLGPLTIMGCCKTGVHRQSLTLSPSGTELYLSSLIHPPHLKVSSFNGSNKILTLNFNENARGIWTWPAEPPTATSGDMLEK